MIVNSKTGILISGTIGKCPELRRVGQNDRPVIKFSLRYGSEQDASGKRRGKYIDVDVWEKAEELDGMLAEDDQIIVTAQEIKTREYNGKTYHSISATGVYPGAGVVFRWLQQVIDMIPAASTTPAPPEQTFQLVDEPAPFDPSEPLDGHELYPGEKIEDHLTRAVSNTSVIDQNTDYIDGEPEDLPF